MADAVHGAASSTRSFRLARVRSASCNMFARRRTIVLGGHDCLHQKRAVISRVQDLFEEAQEIETTNTAAPLATRMRQRSLEEFVGQEHILGPGKLLRRAIEADRLPSVILSGPPGTGKTTLAQIIARLTNAKFQRLSGVESNVAEMRKVVAAAAGRIRTSGQKTIV